MDIKYTPVSTKELVPIVPARLLPFDFQKTHDFSKRKEESLKIRTKYPDRIPVICEIYKKDRHELKLDKNKYLVPSNLTVGQFVYVIRRRIKLKPEKALYIFTEDNTLPPTAQSLDILLRDHGTRDGFLYFLVSSESTFG